VDLAINGLVEATPEDHELLERGMAIFDGSYTVLKRKTVAPRYVVTLEESNEKATIALAFLWHVRRVANGLGPDYGDAGMPSCEALKDAKITLQRGLTASAKAGKPISAKYEVRARQSCSSRLHDEGDTFSEVVLITNREGREGRSRSPAARPHGRRRGRARQWPKRSGPRCRCVGER